MGVGLLEIVDKKDDKCVRVHIYIREYRYSSKQVITYPSVSTKPFGTTKHTSDIISEVWETGRLIYIVFVH